MKRVFKISPFVWLALFLTPGCEPKPDWEEAVSEWGRFSVMMPGEPTAYLNGAPVGILILDYYAHGDDTRLKDTLRFDYIVFLGDGKYCYWVLCQDMDEEWTGPEIDSVKRRTISRIQSEGHEPYYRDITFSGYSGLEFGWEYDTKVIINKAYFVGTRHYWLHAEVPKGRHEKVKQKFFDSFQLTESP